MKLRVRSTESNQTLKIEIPNPSTLLQLKQILSQTLPNSPSPNSINLSLNRRDNLQSEPEASLQSLGIAAGDLIFYSIDSSADCSTSFQTPNTVVESDNSISLNSDRQKWKTIDLDSKSELKGALMEIDEITSSKTVLEAENSDFSSLDSQKRKALDSDLKLEGDMDVDCEASDSNNRDEFVVNFIGEKSFTVPGFLRKVFMEELGNDSGHDHKLVVIAVHAVLLESGFVGFDPNANVVVKRSCCPDVWPSRMFSLSLYYTLPEIGTKHTVVLKFQSLGKFLSVYGSLSGGVGGGKIGTRMVRLNEELLVPFLNVVWANCGVKENVDSQDGGFAGTSPEEEVFKFWRTVKDNLALPLLIDICEKASLELPPCFMRLPTDLKLKIVELLSGVEIAKVSGTCSELRYLGSSDELWKLKCEEEFGKDLKKGEGSWKRAFVMNWETRRFRRLFPTRAGPLSLRGRRGMGYGRLPFAPPQFPGIIGGDYDMWPNFGGNAHIRLAGGHVNRLNFSPPCDLGRLDG